MLLFSHLSVGRLQIAGHPRVQKAFGVDTRAFFPLTHRHVQWEVLFVGMFVEYKRPWLLARKLGRRLAIGRLDLSPDMLVGALH
jgi:hypothetical protein